MEKIRLGVIGTGLAFRELHVPALRALGGRFEVVTLCNRTVGDAHATAEELEDWNSFRPSCTNSVEEVLADSSIDAIDIAVPIDMTSAMVRRSLLAGKHVFAEKPLSDDVSTGEELISLAKERSLVLAVGENFRYQPRFRQVRDLAWSGIIGQPLMYRLNDLHYTEPNSKYAATHWRREGRHKGGYLIDGGTHIVAGMRESLGRDALRVTGLIGAFYPEVFSNQPDAILLQLEFEGGMIGQMALGYATVDRDSRRPKVYGREGTLTLFPDHIEVWSPVAGSAVRHFPVDSSPGFEEEWLDFYGALTEKTPLRASPEESLKDLQVIVGGLESARTGKVVELRNLAT